jgi:hypothetical protein
MGKELGNKSTLSDAEKEMSSRLSRKIKKQMKQSDATGLGSLASLKSPLRSAASLALECRQCQEAEKLIATALAGEPPAENSRRTTRPAGTSGDISACAAPTASRAST